MQVFLPRFDRSAGSAEVFSAEQKTVASLSPSDSSLVSDGASAEKQRTFPSFEQILEQLSNMKENVREGRPAGLDKEEKYHQPGLDAFKKAESDPDRLQKETLDVGMQRIRSVLGVMGFEPNDIGAYLQAMTMPEVQGTSDGAIERQLIAQEEALEAQRRQQLIDSKLNEPQQASASITSNVSVADVHVTPIVNYLLQGRIEVKPEQQALDDLRQDILRMKSMLG